VIKTLRLCMVLRVRQVEKNACGFEKMRCFFIKFSSKIDGKSMPKVRKTISARKIYKMSLPGTTFCAKNQFLVDLGVPAGSQN